MHLLVLSGLADMAVLSGTATFEGGRPMGSAARHTVQNIGSKRIFIDALCKAEALATGKRGQIPTHTVTFLIGRPFDFG